MSADRGEQLHRSSHLRLNAEARKAVGQLLGPDSDGPLADFRKHGPPNVMGEENAKRWQEEYREKKAEEEKAKAQEQPKKRARKGRNR